MPKREGNLKVRKGTALYGPLARPDLVKLVESGRVGESDQVSADDGPWQPVGTYLARTAEVAPPSEPEADSPWKSAAPVVSRQAPAEAPSLHVLREDRVFPMMTRQQVAQLLAARRLTGDELICALNGPWMHVRDFFAPPAPDQAPAARAAAPTADEEIIYAEDHVHDHQAYEEAPVEEAVDVLEVIDDEYADPLPDPAMPLGSIAYQEPAQKPKRLSNNWYVKVRGIHSAPMQKHDLKMLLAAREIRPDSPVSHVTWESLKWLPLCDIAELADLAKKP